jgi:hypothetical protein
MLVVLVAVQVRQDQGTFIKVLIHHKNTKYLYAHSVFRIRTTVLRIRNPDPHPAVYFSDFLLKYKDISVFKDNKLGSKKLLIEGYAA